MRTQIVYILSFFMMSQAITYKTAAGQDLDWKTCVEQTLKTHPELIKSKQKIKQAEADKKIKSASLLPQITGSANAQTSSSTGTSSQEQYSYGASGKQLIFDGLKTPNEIKQASKQIEAQNFGYQLTSSDIRLNLKTAFAKLIQAQELIGLTQDILNRRTQNSRLVKLRYQGGKEHKGSLLTAEADTAQAQFEVGQAKRNLITSQRNLSIAMGINKFQNVSAQGDFLLGDIYSQKPFFENIVENTPFLKQLIATKDSYLYAKKAAKGEFFPEISLSSSLQRTGQQIQGDTNSFSAGISLSVPIFNGGSNINRVKKTHAAFLQSQADVESGYNQIILTLEQNWKSLQDEKELLKVRQKFLQAAQERAKIAQAQYKIGLITFNEWSIIEDSLANSQKAYLSAQVNLIISEANWIHTIGGTLDDSIS